MKFNDLNKLEGIINVWALKCTVSTEAAVAVTYRVYTLRGKRHTIVICVSCSMAIKPNQLKYSNHLKRKRSSIDQEVVVSIN